MSERFKIAAVYNYPGRGVATRVVANALTRERAEKMLRELEGAPKPGIDASYSIQPD